MTFTVAIVGRPNVGKSTLFNRLVGRRLALVDDTPGVTRDRRDGNANLGGLEFRVIDTAGLDEGDPDSLVERMRRQTDTAVAEADVVILLFDARVGITPMDQHFARALRKTETPVVLVGNKCEAAAAEPGLIDAYELGLGPAVPISAEHGEGMADLFEALLAEAPDEAAAPPGEHGEADAPDRLLRIAIVGRPNVGKSTLVNKLLGEERVVTGPESGLTRDSIAVEWQVAGRRVQLVDTAGLRRRARIQETLEKLSAADALRALGRAEVIVLVMDSNQPMEKQDLALAALATEEGRALVLAINKWDIVSDAAASLRRVQDRLQTSLPQIKGLPILKISAKTGEHVDRLLPAVIGAHDQWNRRLSTGVLNRWLEWALARHPPPAPQGRRLRLRYITQAKARPPTFVIFVSKPSALPDSYVSYLTNDLREAFGLQGVPIRMHLRKGENPYAARAGKRKKGKKKKKA